MSFQGVYGGGGYAFTDPDTPPAHLLPLDPVSVARQANIDRISSWAKTQGFTAALYACDLITGSAGMTPVLDAEISVEDQTRFRNTSAKWRTHLEELVQYKVVEKCDQAHMRFQCTYFAVPKSKTCSRSIFNGAALSDKCITPPPVNLLDIPRIVQLVSELAGTGSPRLYGFTADIRHWFHQVPISDQLSRYFYVRCAEQSYRFRVLPMGWSFSPYVCQALAWTCILQALSECYPQCQGAWSHIWASSSLLERSGYIGGTRPRA